MIARKKKAGFRGPGKKVEGLSRRRGAKTDSKDYLTEFLEVQTGPKVLTVPLARVVTGIPRDFSKALKKFDGETPENSVIVTGKKCVISVI